MDMNELIHRFNVSSLRRSKFLYVFSIFITLCALLSELPMSKDSILMLIFVLSALISYILVVVALFRLATHINDVLHFPGGFILPGKRCGKMFSHILLVLFFVWLLGWASVITNWINPQILNSSTIKPGVDQIIDALFAGPIEETWRWAFILSVFYFGTRVFATSKQTFVLWVSVGLSCLIFGFEHFGQVKGYDFITVGVTGIIGLLFFLYAVWSRSFWTAMFAHTVYDAIAGLPFSYKLLSWWPLAGVLWPVVGFLYFKWRKSRPSVGQEVIFSK